MGYNTKVTGHIKISPPLKWAEIRDGRFLDDDGPEPIIFAVADSGEADAVEAITDDPFRAYDLQEYMQEILDLHSGGHAFTGELFCRGDDDNDLWRLVIREGDDGRARAVKAKGHVVWADQIDALRAESLLAAGMEPGAGLDHVRATLERFLREVSGES